MHLYNSWLILKGTIRLPSQVYEQSTTVRLVERNQESLC